jgi:hypothetical protein
MEANAGMMHLPPELLKMVIKNLDDTDLKSISRVNHYLRDAAVDELFKKVDLRCGGDSIVEFYDDILHFSNLSFPSEDEEMKSCGLFKRFVPGRKIQEIALSVGQRVSDRKKIDDVVACFPGVTSILFEACGSRFSSLRVRTILAAAVQSMDHLHTIKWIWRSGLYSLPLDKMARFPTITNLVIDFAQFEHIDVADVGLSPVSSVS